MLKVTRDRILVAVVQLNDMDPLAWNNLVSAEDFDNALKEYGRLLRSITRVRATNKEVLEAITEGGLLK